MGSFLREPIPVYEAGGTGQRITPSGQRIYCKHCSSVANFFADIHSFFQSVRDINSSTISSNR